MRNFNIAVALCLLIFLLGLNTKGYSQLKRDPLNNAVIVSVKFGYQLSEIPDSVKVPIWWEENLPGAFNFDISMDIPLGKYYFAGIKYNGWFSKDDVYDYLDDINFTRTMYGSNTDIIFKYRYPYKNFLLTPGIGVGYTSIKHRFKGYDIAERTPRNDGLFNYNVQFDIEYFLTKNILLSAGVSYYGVAQIDAAKGKRRNKLFQFKAGFNYNFFL